jgi:hypothetical protein
VGRLWTLKVRGLAEGLVLAPERYDPRRQVSVRSDHVLGDLFEIALKNIQPIAVEQAQVLALDTTHAFEGAVLFKHAPVLGGGFKSAKRLLEPGDVIISRLRPYLRQVAYVDPALFQQVESGNLVVASTEFFVLRSNAEADAAALVPYLLSEPVQTALSAAQEGGHHPRLSKATIAELPIPDWFVGDSERIGAEVREAVGKMRVGQEGLRDLVRASGARCG